ncbi:hypothetical protein D1224_11815 [Henriciella barbarensis]|uniref:Uncharacterized protein n=1 Tax=Henriciella barbarensis TaxID=86342 RepID=A0A399QVP1_9PROT|nr:hypothetical protein [Henriciella barbarensis]RIJ22235.1 hypothetical protein D1224_11815 [Henriciella barbarensis]
MTRLGHGNLFENITTGLFSLRHFRLRVVRWPLATFLAGLGVHAATVQSVTDGPKGFAVPTILFLFALLLVLLPLLPIADGRDKRDWGI